jgi:putative spermidine/putrescine transport system ATP-binding protein
MSVAIRLERCGKVFPDGTRALEPLDLEIAPGETLVILGPSGCGKTTALRIIAGLEAADPGGRVLFDAEDVTARPIERRNVGMVFQTYALFPNMSVAENVAYGLKVRGASRGERRARTAEMLAMMRIEELERRRVDQLSGGQRQRVALARALAPHPRALLLDEPLTALDAKLRDQLRAEIDRLLRGLGVTAVYVTHDQAEAMALGDRIAVMSKGRVAQIGTPREIYFRPANRFVAEFVGTMNRLAGTAADGRLSVPGGAIAWNGGSGPVEVYFRPEDVRTAEAAAANLAGTIESAQFLGDRLRLMVDVGADRPIVIETSDLGEYRPGSAIHLFVPPDRLVAF